MADFFSSFGHYTWAFPQPLVSGFALGLEDEASVQKPPSLLYDHEVVPVSIVLVAAEEILRSGSASTRSMHGDLPRPEQGRPTGLRSRGTAFTGMHHCHPAKRFANAFRVRFSTIHAPLPIPGTTCAKLSKSDCFSNFLSHAVLFHNAGVDMALRKRHGQTVSHFGRK
jgi:hypothetical protein